jgi:hypothetical protein
MSIFQFVELEVRFDSDTSLCGADCRGSRSNSGVRGDVSAVECEVEIRLATSTPGRG